MQAMFRSILVAIDESEAASAALGEAIDLARSEGARLTLISVAASPRILATGPYIPPVPTEDELVRRAEEVLARAEALVPEDVPVVTVIRRGAAAEGILERIELGGHDLVVMGSRGLGRVGGVLLGSVSGAVAARSPVPVLIARGAPTDGDLFEKAAA
jgi:nucleotide-binding universal stress UspA family protein